MKKIIASVLLVLVLIPFSCFAKEEWIGGAVSPVFEWGTTEISTSGSSLKSNGFAMFPFIGVTAATYYDQQNRFGMGCDLMFGYNYSSAVALGTETRTSSFIINGRISFQYKHRFNDKLSLEAKLGIGYSGTFATIQSGGTKNESVSMTLGPTLGVGILHRVTNKVALRTGLDIYIPVWAKISNFWDAKTRYFGIDFMPYIGFAYNF